MKQRKLHLLTIALLSFSFVTYAELPVPCGACNGGVWVSSGNASLSTSSNALTVKQHTERAILNWESFNISAGNRVDFKQPSTSSVALNRIFQSDPSRILGSLNANGQVLLINPNGILFGAGAQINTHSLIASTLGMPDDVFENLGLTGAINADRAAFEGNSGGAIDIEAGASIKSAKDGRILIIAPEINNAGTIESPDGQTILAAGNDKVYLEASTDPELRGLLVEVETGGDVNNVGQIIAERGNVTLLGAAVNQNGVVRATTSVSRNGTVRLLGRDNASTVVNNQNTSLRNAIATNAGAVTLGEGSKTEVIIDTSDQTLASDAQAQPLSKVEIVAKQVTIKSRAEVTATGGEIDILATENLQNPLAENFVANDARLTIDAAAKLDVSGASERDIPFERNFLEVDLRGNELRDNPVNRDGPIRGQTVVVDARKGTRFADVTPFIEATERSTAERLSRGGTIKLRSEGQLLAEPGSIIDISGGEISFTEGFNTASYLSREGSLISISDADPNVRYDGVFNFIERDYTKWSVTEVFNPFRDQNLWLTEPGYVQGADAGRLDIVARNIELRGDVIAQTTRGINQRFAPGSNYADYQLMPRGGMLTLGDENTTQADYKLGDIVLGDPDSNPLVSGVNLDRLLGAGVIELRVFSNGKIEIPAGGVLDLGNGGALALRAGDIEIGGTVVAPGGEIELTAGQTVTKATKTTVHLASSAELNVAGNWTNDFADVASGNPLTEVFADAGSVVIESSGDVLLDAGSLIDVSGGGFVDESARLMPGRGGDVTLEAGVFAPTVESVLSVDGEIRGYSLDVSGTLSLAAQGFIFGTQTRPGFTSIDLDLFANTGFENFAFTANTHGVVVPSGITLDLTRTQLLFGAAQTSTDVRYTELTAGPEPINALLGSDPVSLVSGESLYANTVIGQLPAAERRPVNLSLSLARDASDDGEIRIEEGARIKTEIGAAVSIESDKNLYLGGEIYAPAGAVSLTTKRRESVEEGYLAEQFLWLGERSQIDVSGVFVPTPQVDGLRDGELFDAGEIILSANRSYLVVESGSDLILDGVLAEIDLVTESNGVPSVVSQAIAGDAGTLSLRSGDGIFFQGEVSMRRAPIPTSGGGTLTVDINAALRETRELPIASGALDFLNGPRQIVLGAPGVSGLDFGQAVAADLNGKAILNNSLLTGADLDSLILSAPAQVAASTNGLVNPNATGSVVFASDLDLTLASSLRLYTPEINVDGANVALSAPVIELGARGQSVPYQPSLVGGTGSLNVTADLMAVRGQLAIQGARDSGAVVFKSGSDLILAGTPNTTNNSSITGSLASVSDLRLDAARIYPTTLSMFSIEVDRPGGRITTRGHNAGEIPLSIAGNLSLTADHVEQGGSLYAPFGSVSIKADKVQLRPGSVTSVSGAGREFLFGQTQFELDWLLPFDGINVVLDNAPDKRINIDADDVRLEAGAIIDVSGGGDLRAFEFVPGPGGSNDILDPASSANSFAILPGTLAQALDTLTGLGNDAFGDTITFADNAVIGAGEFAVLPARYALLPGAYLVTASDTGPAATPGLTLVGSDDVPIVAAKRSVFGSRTEDTLYSNFRLLSGEQVRARTEYAETLGSGFFAAATNRTIDNGTLSLTARDALSLGGTIVANGSGRASAVDLVAERIAVVNTLGSAAPGSVEILAADLNRLGAGSLLLGGTRTQLDASIAELMVASEQIDLFAGVSLLGNEIVLSATDSINMAAGAVMQSAQQSSGGNRLLIDGDGAVVAVSSNRLQLSRSASNGVSGELNIAPGAALSARGAVIADASTDANFQGKINAPGAEVTLGGQEVALGDAPNGLGGLVLSDAILAGLSDARSLTLRSGATIDLYGSSSINLDAVTFDASGFRGFLNPGDTFTITANEAQLVNSQDGTGAVAAGDGVFSFNTTEMDFGGGALTFNGFESINLQTETFGWSGDATLLSSAPTTINAGVFKPHSSSRLVIDVANELVIGAGSLNEESVTEAALGAALDISADSLAANAHFNLPSGKLALRSTFGDIDLSGASIDLSGTAKSFDGTRFGTPGGSLLINAALDLALDGANINVAGESAAGGSVSLVASGAVSTTNTVFNADTRGQFSLVADDASSADLLTAVQTGGFNELIELRLNSADIEVAAADVITARWISLVSDSGDVRLAGALIADDEFDGGRVRLFAGDELVLSDGAVIAARGTAGHGGLVELGAGSGGSVSIGQALFDLNGSTEGGTLRIRASAIGGGAAINQLAANYQGVDLFELEVFDVFNGSIQAAINGLNALSPNLTAVSSSLGLNSLAFARVVPGAELQLGASYTSSSALDLSNRRYNGWPGVLTIRAAGDITLNHHLSDGVVNYEPFPGGLPPREGVGNDDSWSYRLVAGADLSSADPLAVFDGTGDVTVKNNVQVRTGSGAIDIIAGNNLSLLGTNSNIYTVGKNRGTGSYGPLLTEVYLEADFVSDGGRLNIDIGNDINATARGQLVNDWLARYEGTEPFQGLGTFGAGWAVAISRFQQGLGALGGGDVRVRAGGDITELGVAVPTTGLPTGGLASQPDIAGGGSIDIQTGGDYLGGLVYAADGRLVLRSGGAITAQNASGNNLLIALGDSQAQLSSVDDLRTEAVFDPFLLPQSNVQGASIFGSPIVPDKKDTFSYFSNYGSNATLALESIAGSVLFAQDTDALNAVSNAINITTTADTTAARVVVPSLQLISHNGSVKFANGFTLYPAAQAQFAIFAERDIAEQAGILNSVIINLSDADPSLLPSFISPAKTNNFLADRLAGFDNALGTSHALTPVHINDPNPARVVSRNGTLGATGNTLFALTLGKAADIYAGAGIQNFNLQVQHSKPGDFSIVESGGAIAYPFGRNSQGFLSGATGQLAVAGPGTMAVIANGDIDLGTSRGIVSLGDTKNPNLADTGADLIVMSGLSATNNEAFADYLFDLDASYQSRFNAFVNLHGAQAGSNALATFNTLDEDLQRSLLVELFFEELIASGIDATSTGSDDYSRGFAAIEQWFGNDLGSGDLSLLLSRIATIDGGDVNVLAPNGLINAGVATATAIQKTPDQLGIVAQRDGNVNIFVHDDLLVNQSRVFTLDGGRIAIWSSAGDIDAGRGAKSAVSIPGLVTTIDTAGNVITEFPPAVEGSGIRAAVATPGRAPGDVFLFAPRGAVIAGDAGIGSAGNLTIGATEVVGADNIDVGGVSVGVPASDVGSVAAGLTGVSDSSTSASKAAQDNAGNSVATNDDAINEALSQGALSFISVEVLGFGG